MEAFLQFLARDIAAHPGSIRELDKRQVARIGALVKGVSVDLDAPLDRRGE